VVKHNSPDRCKILYQHCKHKNEIFKQKLKVNNEEKDRKFLMECTFKPRTNSANPVKTDKSHLNYNYKGEKNMYKRTVNWKQQNLQKIDKEKTEKSKNSVVYSFKPKVNKANKEIFDSKKNINKGEKTTKKFMERLVNARTEEQLKKERMNNLGKVIASNNKEKIKVGSDKITTNSLNLNKNTSIDANNQNTVPNNHDKDLDFTIKNLRNQLQGMNFETQV